MRQPLDAITSRAKQDGTRISSTLSDSDLNAAGSTASGKDVAFVFITGNNPKQSDETAFTYTRDM